MARDGQALSSAYQLDKAGKLESRLAAGELKKARPAFFSLSLD